ncbi:hypothetical protein COT64_00385 [Candidatus Shapirobacteria bacterium CG09_land_8_20_14_0_10_39_12]|uniref:NodB homology domain-containing protein n=1 Tax=Candidatus Shapirobacteria bacterium CG09_land_8_20_14_0_10_39_12 TaxID=1974885 RepID=A0A2H0WSF5_9BACT|nr:MAG: hypothetical protein COT64_00385 [Candidatus Shapirobacteria bacterium CG09_land_8_20_14_0_10_39_12]
MNKGIFCISIDLELLWGRKDLNYKPFIPKVDKVRKVVKQLLVIFSKNNIPVTWAVVGKLFTSPTNPSNRNRLWYGKDIIRAIQNTPNQEIACHSFSHPEFTTLTREMAEKEIANSVKVAKMNGIILKSFIFPRNKVAHGNILKKYGFTSFRGMDKRPWELLFPGTPSVYEPKREYGVLNIPGSMYFVSARGIRKYIPTNLRYLKVILGINKAIKEHKVFHLWLHPVDLANNTKSLLNEIEKIILFANKKRVQEKLDIKTMSEISDLLLK